MGGNGVIFGIFDNQISFSRIIEIVWFYLSAALLELYLNYATVLFFIIGIYFLIVNFKEKALLFFHIYFSFNYCFVIFYMRLI